MLDKNTMGSKIERKRMVGKDRLIDMRTVEAPIPTKAAFSRLMSGQKFEDLGIDDLFDTFDLLDTAVPWRNALSTDFIISRTLTMYKDPYSYPRREFFVGTSYRTKRTTSLTFECLINRRLGI